MHSCLPAMLVLYMLDLLPGGKLLAKLAGGFHHVSQGGKNFLPATGFQATVRIDPDTFRRNHPDNPSQNLQDGFH